MIFRIPFPDDRGKSFRDDYLKITWLRPVMNEAAFLFLTAICTAKMKAEILQQFSVDSVAVTAAIPNR
jgi:superfamily II DNA helicase RecQ